MSQRTYPGHCLIGNTETTKRKAKNEIIRNLKKERVSDQTKGSWLVQFQGEYQPAYWIILLVEKDATLEEIDAKLRYLWLECCGHLSEFTIHRQSFHSHPDTFFDEDNQGMDIKVDRLFAVGLTGEYVYDFGDSTYLTFKVLDFVGFAPDDQNGVELVAQNHPPDIRCSACGEPADEICTSCLYDGNPDDAFLCEDCFAEHACDEDMSLPIVNSPRMGQCGYTG